MTIRQTFTAQREVPKKVFFNKITLPKNSLFGHKDNFCYRFTMHGSGTDSSRPVTGSMCDTYFNLYLNPYSGRLTSAKLNRSVRMYMMFRPDAFEWDLIGVMEVTRAYFIDKEWNYHFIPLEDFKTIDPIPTKSLNILCKDVVQQQADITSGYMSIAKILAYSAY